MSEINDFLNLKAIVEKATNNSISLPTVQRGFVWKPYQIENLWDSLLRGYPVGSFVLSEKINSAKEQYELLDGQQRASAICLGFYDPLTNKNNTNHKIFKTSNENIMVFIDLMKPNPENDNRKYLFRVITKSHPWGYRRQENQKILESKNRNEAMSFYKIENNNYLKKPLKDFWPYDSFTPIPFGLFINARDINDLKNSINIWQKELMCSGEIKLQVKKINEQNIQCYTIEEIFSDVQNMLESQRIPLLFLASSHLYASEKNITNNSHNADTILEDESNGEAVEETNGIKDSDDEVGKIEDRNISEVENLFIRLNSGGTPLRGEELNYSVLKAHITLDLQTKIEEKSKGLFYPARFITIAFRLYNNILKSDDITSKDSISMNIKPKQFQRLMSAGKKNNFIGFLNQFLDSDIIEKTKTLLVYDINTNQIGLPTFIAYSLADKSPEIMFMLLYRLYVKEDKIHIGLKPHVLGIITLFNWLGKGEKQRDHGKLLENIWPSVKNSVTNTFWSVETIQRAMIMDGDYQILTPFPNLKSLKKIIPKTAKINSLTWAKIYESEYGEFIGKIFYNKDMILYAQRAALSEWFNDIEEYNLEDTNRAFDWDHICPNSFTHNKRNIHRALKDWYPSNGNFRAWPYSLNRGDQDDPPAIKLKNQNDQLLSFCNKEWMALGGEVRRTIKDNLTSKQIINCILNRNLNICLEWYDKLKINDLVPSHPNKQNIKSLFGSVINNSKWKPEKVDETRLAYFMKLGLSNLSIYFSFNIDASNTLKENDIYFGIYEEDSNSIVGKIKVSSEQIDYFTHDNYFYSYFTLISFNENSVHFLFNEFYSWLMELKFQDKTIKNELLVKFNDSLKNKYKVF